MNRIFKTLWNASRGCVTVVSESVSTHSASGAYGTEHQKRTIQKITPRKFVKTSMTTALASVFLLLGGNAEAAKSFPTNCSSVGGKIMNGVCYIGDGTQTSSILETVNDEWTLTEGNMTIMGGRKIGLAPTFALDHIASDGGTGSILNTGSGTLTISGGNYAGSYALSSCADGTGSVSTISNLGSGDIIFKSGAGTSMYAHANGGTGIISNLGSGNVIIKNDSPSGIEGYTAGIQINCLNGGTAILSNQGTGDLIISGGSAKSAYGMATNASSRGTSSILNTGSGTTTITGGSGTSSYGIETNAFSTGTITNEQDGNLNILGGAGEFAFGIRINVNNGDGKIINSGSGILTISGGSGSGASAIQFNTHGRGPTSTISNEGNGTLIISGGSGSKAYGIGHNTGRLRAVSIISNTGSGTLTISGGSKSDAYGIYSFSAYSGNKGIISNAEKYSLQGTTQGNGLTGGLPPVRFSM